MIADVIADQSHPPSSFEEARARARDAGLDGDWPQAVRWAERAWRLAGQRPLAALEFAAALLKAGDARATGLLARAAEHHQDFPVLIALAAAQNRDGTHSAAQATLHRLLTTVAVDIVPPLAALANEIAAKAGLQGWLGWRNGRLLLGTAHDPAAAAFTLDRRKLALEWIPEGPGLWSASLPPDSVGPLRVTPPLLGAPLRPAPFRQPQGSMTRRGARLHGWIWFPRDPGRDPGLTITLVRRGRPSEIAVRDLTLLPPDETDPFARRWGFDLAVPIGATVIGATETVSGHAIALEDSPRRAAAMQDSTSDPGRPEMSPRQAADIVVLVTHDEGGGIERHVQHRLAVLRRAGKFGLPLRSRRDRPGAVQLGGTVFHLPADAPALLGQLRDIAPSRIEYHQPRRHDDVVWQLAEALALPYDVYLHDYALLCPRATLVGADGSYCGEPPVTACERCIASFEPRQTFAPAGVAALRRRSAALLSRATLVRAPSADIARRFRRHMPGPAITTRPWETIRPAPPPPTRRQQHAHICVVGALNQHKGFGILLDCARDAAIRGLPIRFTVVGHTIDDAALIGAGAFVTGPYQDAERDGLIARQHATLGFMPSIWPEPWCYALTGLIEAGLPTLCFDIGAQAERVRAAGGTVLPLGISASEINRHILDRHILDRHRLAMSASMPVVT